MQVYGDLHSGNCYKVKLVMNLLNIAHAWIHTDILNGDTHTTSFKLKNPNSKIPLLELDDGRCLSESNAIINYLADGSHLVPDDPFLRAQVQQWQFFEQYSHEPYIAVARYINKYLKLPAERVAEYQAKQEGGHKALAVMEQQLAGQPFIAGDSFTTADVSLYAYTHVADEGGFELAIYPAIEQWLARVAEQPGFITMQQTLSGHQV
ncbi:glutathione S-transferase family protein [Salinimonas lutimaris]|uniref:glutathione S-transferase family protein n=1 Tax=Salinimonas lutimaris TaxID=914153 RepID=UPI0010BF7665|nr:glutathione S-transferase family protein [Salinimonas lutimaris]